MMDYHLTTEQFECALAEMKARRRSATEHTVFALVQALIHLRLTRPFCWIVRHQDTFRTLMRLE